MVIRYKGIEVDPVGLEMRHRGRKWTPLRKKSLTFRGLQSLICGGGLSTAQLFWIMYGNDPEGGPDAGHHILLIWFCKWKDIFKQLDLELHSVKIAGVLFYRLEPTHRF